MLVVAAVLAEASRYLATQLSGSMAGLDRMDAVEAPADPQVLEDGQLFDELFGEDRAAIGMAQPVGIGDNMQAAADDDDDDGDHDDRNNDSVSNIGSVAQANTTTDPVGETIVAGAGQAIQATSPPDAPPAIATAQSLAQTPLALASSVLQPPSVAPASSSTGATCSGSAQVKVAGMRRISSRPRIPDEAVEQLQAQQRVQSSAEDLADMVDGNEVDFHPMGIDRPFPTGVLFKALQRSRGTINQRCAEMGSIHWYVVHKLATLTQLARRWSAHRTEIEGQYNLDVQTAFAQCCRRADALVDVHRRLRQWLETAQAKRIAEVYDPLMYIVRFMTHTGKVLAPDLQVIKAYATFHNKHGATQNFVTAFRTLKLADLDAWLKDYQQEFARLPVSKKVKQEVSDDGPQEDEEDDQEDSGAEAVTATKKKKSGAKRAGTTIPIESRIDMFMPGAIHGAWLLCEGIKHHFFHMTEGDLQDSGMLNETLNRMQAVSKIWREEWVNNDIDEAKKFDEVLTALILNLQCLFMDESRRPPSDHVRAARRVILMECKVAGPDGELAKAAIAYNSLKSAMSASRTHSAQGLEDVAALNVFEGAATRFESDFQLCFDDLAGWAVLSDGVTLGERMSHITRLKGMLVALSSVSERLSPAALQDNIACFIDTVGNLVSILGASVWTMFDFFAKHVFVALEALGDCKATHLCVM